MYHITGSKVVYDKTVVQISSNPNFDGQMKTLYQLLINGYKVQQDREP